MGRQMGEEFKQEYNHCEMVPEREHTHCARKVVPVIQEACT